MAMLQPVSIRPAIRPVVPLSVVEQVRRSTRKTHRLAMACGAVLGAFVPGAVYWLAHTEASARPMLWVLIAAGLAFSATTVYEFGRSAFQHTAKAMGFVVLLEGVMVASSTRWLALVALVLLVAINAVSTGCNLALEHSDLRRQRRHA